MTRDRITRSRFLGAALGSWTAARLDAEQPTLALRGHNLYLDAPSLDILRGAALERLKNGRTVPFDFHLWLWAGSRTNLLRRAFERFVVSYDLWEERYSVTGLRHPRPTAANLSASAVPAWCLDHVSLHPVDLPADTRVWVRLDVRAAESKEDETLVDDAGLSLTYLIDLLSKPSRKQQSDRWTLEAGPVRIGALR